MGNGNVKNLIVTGLIIASQLISFNTYSNSNSLNDVCSNVEKRNTVMTALITKYGGYKEAIKNVDNLSLTEASCLTAYLIELQKHKIQMQQNGKTQLEVLDATNRQQSVIEQLKLDSDEAYIQEKKALSAKAQIAENKYPFKIPKAIIDTVAFDPNKPQQLNLYVLPGFPGAFSFFDNTGAEWPVERVYMGDKKAFTAEPTKTPAYAISATEWGRTYSGWFELKGLDNVIPFTISSIPRDSYNMRRKIIIPSIGPMAKKPEIIKLNNRKIDYSEATPEVFAFINGTVDGIDGAKEVPLLGIEGESYLYNGFVYIRTKAQLKGAALILVHEAALGEYHLYQLYKRAMYRFYDGRKIVKAFVKYE